MFKPLLSILNISHRHPQQPKNLAVTKTQKNNLNFIFLFLISLSLNTNLALAQNQNCQPKPANCQFYQCAEQQFRCGTNGYFQKFAGPYCNYFFNETYNKVSASTQKWLVDVAYCLQTAVEKSIQNNPQISCNKIRSKAIQSHSECYVKTGFCQLDRTEQAYIISILAKDAWRPEIAAQGLLIEFECTKQLILNNH